MFQTYEEARDWIVGLVPFGIRPGLERMERFMEALGHPERRLKFIHVAGTNGKGSVCAYLSNVLHKCGYDVGTFTSPYIEKYTNRIQVGGEDIPEASVVQLVNRIKPIYDDIASSELGSPTSFEVSTVLALLYFATEAYPDYVVWETGLGGRLDSTNIVHPVACVITSIGYDHVDVLGSELADIAREKAGIIKAGIPVITAVKQPEAMAVIKEVAAQKQATLYAMGGAYDVEVQARAENEQRFRFNGPFRSLEDVTVSMNGLHQIENAAVAVMTIEMLRQYYALIADEADVLAGLRETSWAGRLEMVQRSPRRLLLDGAHNAEGAEALVEALLSTYTYDRLHIMLGMLESKNHRGVIEHILPIADTLIITEPDFIRKMDSGRLAQLIEDQIQTMGRQVNLIVEPDWRLALQRLKDATGTDDLAVVTGTLYLISDVRSSVHHQAETEKGW